MNRSAKFMLMMSVGVIVLAFSGVAFAQDADTVVQAARSSAGGWIGLGAGLGIGIAAFGGGLGQGRATATALDGMARNPSAADQLFKSMILGLALIESLVIYALIISFLLLGKIV
ncbi:MAG TPA: F0F1 ATP synthase subunit C [Kofleriaceae bacterium]|nr:F0F1 ATP synthase subunit C [Kofleriaceae bacterium]